MELEGTRTVLWLVGGVANLALLVGLGLFALRRRARRAPLVTAAVALAGLLGVLAATWWTQAELRQARQAALVGAEPWTKVELANAGALAEARSARLGLWLALLPALAGTLFTAWGLLGRPAVAQSGPAGPSERGGPAGQGEPAVPNEPAPDRRRGRLTAVLAIACTTAGCGLALLALVDFLRFETFFALLMMRL